MDDKLFECKGFEDMNSESYAQANRDVMRLVAQINDLERIEASAVQGIATKEQEILTGEKLRRKQCFTTPSTRKTRLSSQFAMFFFTLLDT